MDWKKEFSKVTREPESVEVTRGLISLTLTDDNNRIINELEKVNGGSFKSEDDAIDFYQSRCHLYEDWVQGLTRLYIDRKEVKIWYDKPEKEVETSD